MTNLKISIGLLLILVIATTGGVFAASIDKTILVPRQPNVYARNVSATLNTKTGQTLVVWERHPGIPGDVSGHSVWAQLLQPDGKLMGKPFQILSSNFNPIN